MKNNRSVTPASEPELGPLPTRRRDPAQGLSESRAGVLDHLRSAPQPATLADLTAATGLHANTLREHLDALVRRGLARRFHAEPHGRGRPPWLYEATDLDTTAGGASEYAGLATTLAAAIHRGSSTPREDAVEAGTEWGRDLARHRGSSPGAEDTKVRGRVLDLLEDLGFSPETDQQDATVRLTRCPLLDAAHRYTDVVCGVHLGIVRGALAEQGATSAGTELQPFAEPGACLLELPLPSEPTR